MYTECDETNVGKCKEGYLNSSILNSKRRQDKTRGKFYHFRNLVLLSLLSHKTSFMECCVMMMMLLGMVWGWYCLYSTGCFSFILHLALVRVWVGYDLENSFGSQWKLFLVLSMMARNDWVKTLCQGEWSAQ